MSRTAISAASGGQYNIVLNSLPSDSDSQRTQLVRRLAAKDSGIDIIGMDVNWTARIRRRRLERRIVAGLTAGAVKG